MVNETLLPVIPPNERVKFIRDVHRKGTSHIKADKLFDLVQRLCLFSHFEKLNKEAYGLIRELVREVIARCPTCAKVDLPSTGGADRLHPITSKKFLERVQIDLKDFTNFRSPSEKKYCMSIVDHYTNYACVHALHTKESVIVWEKFERFCMIYGRPDIVHTDNGGEFAKCVFFFTIQLLILF